MNKEYFASFLALSVMLNLLTSAHASPVTLDFSGTFGGGGTVSGSFTYDNAAAPLASNVRGLAPNATFPITTWNFTIDGGSFLPSTTFVNDVAGNSVEFCLGVCVFSSPEVINLIFSNSNHLLLQLTFDPLLDPTPFTSPPADPSAWGGFNPQTQRSSEYRVPCPVCVPVALFQAGALTATHAPTPDCKTTQASPAVLWSPRHQFVPVVVMGVTDLNGDSGIITVTSVTQDEPVHAKGDGNRSPDAMIQDGAASVRAERSGTGN